MASQEERTEIQSEPLPVIQSVAVIDYVTNCPANRVLTNIVLIDEQIEAMANQVRPFVDALNRQRGELLERARREEIAEDDVAVLVRKEGKRERADIDLESFATTYPHVLEQIRADQEKAIRDKAENQIKALPSASIPLGMADKKLGKQIVTDFVGYLPATITYEVRRK